MDDLMDKIQHIYDNLVEEGGGVGPDEQVAVVLKDAVVVYTGEEEPDENGDPVVNVDIINDVFHYPTFPLGDGSVDDEDTPAAED